MPAGALHPPSHPPSHSPWHSHSPGPLPWQLPLAEADPAVAACIAAEVQRQAQRLDLVASENTLSLAQREASGSVLGAITTEGYPGARWLAASAEVDALERLAIARACQLFGAAHANVQPHSGTQANQAVYLALLAPGDCVLSMALGDGGHFSHGDADNLSGKWFRHLHYGVRADDGLIDYDAAQRLAQQHRPRLVIAGASAYPRAIDFERLAQIAHSVGARLMADIAHVAGLVACGLFPHPFPHADLVTTTTYKNLRGVHGGLILCNDATLAAQIDAAVCPGVQGTPLLGLIAGKAVALGEALHPAFAGYQRQVLANARALGAALQARGLRLVTGGTDTPFVLVDLRALGLNGRAASARLDAIQINASPAPVPGDADLAGASGLRLGVSAITSRGLREDDCRQVAELVADLVTDNLGPPGAQRTAHAARQVRALCARFPIDPQCATPVA